MVEATGCAKRRSAKRDRQCRGVCLIGPSSTNRLRRRSRRTATTSPSGASYSTRTWSSSSLRIDETLHERSSADSVLRASPRRSTDLILERRLTTHQRRDVASHRGRADVNSVCTTRSPAQVLCDLGHVGHFDGTECGCSCPFHPDKHVRWTAMPLDRRETDASQFGTVAGCQCSQFDRREAGAMPGQVGEPCSRPLDTDPRLIRDDGDRARRRHGL